MIERKKFALNYFENGLIPIPLCWTNNNKCACFMKHSEEKLIGKAPLVKYTNKDITRETVEEWFTRFPKANIGILIRESGLVVVDADSERAIEEVERAWFDPALVPSVKTGRGKHYYFKANRKTPEHRTIHTGISKMIDVFSNGYIVAPPSIHRNGHVYVWDTPPKRLGIPNVPLLIETFLTIEAKKKSLETTKLNSIKLEVTGETKRTNINNLPLNSVIKSLIVEGQDSKFYKERGYNTPSEALFGTMIACYKQGLSDDEVFNIFSNPEYAMSYKFFENKRSETWLKGEMKRAKGKKNSRSPKTTTPYSSHITRANHNRKESKTL